MGMRRGRGRTITVVGQDRLLAKSPLENSDRERFADSNATIPPPIPSIGLAGCQWF